MTHFAAGLWVGLTIAVVVILVCLDRMARDLRACQSRLQALEGPDEHEASPLLVRQNNHASRHQ